MNLNTPTMHTSMLKLTMVIYIDLVYILDYEN